MNLITWYFNKKLETWGYGECDVNYSLGYCQGDGVAWYGGLDDSDIRRHALSKLRLPPQIAAINRILDKGALSVSIRKVGPHMYDHFNTMDVDHELDEDELTPMEQATALELIGAIESDVVDRSKELERDGYGIIEARPCEKELLRQYEHGDVVVQVWKHPPLDDMDNDWMDPADQYLFVRRMIRGEIELYDLEVEVSWRGVTSGHSVCEVSDTPDGRYWHELARELMREDAIELRALHATNGNEQKQAA